MSTREIFAVVVLLSLVACDATQSNQTRAEAAQQKVYANTRDRWAREPDSVLQELNAFVGARKYLDALKALSELKAAGVADPRIDSAERALKISQRHSMLSAARNDTERLFALNALAEVRPDDAEIKKSIVALKQKMERERAQAKRAEVQRIAAEKARRKREGVSVGMTQADVLASSWGRPQSVNKTILATITREQWVYHGEYLYFDNGILTAIQTRR